MLSTISEVDPTPAYLLYHEEDERIPPGYVMLMRGHVARVNGVWKKFLSTPLLLLEPVSEDVAKHLPADTLRRLTVLHAGQMDGAPYRVVHEFIPTPQSAFVKTT